MGKATRWFRRLLGLKKETNQNQNEKDKKKKKKRSGFDKASKKHNPEPEHVSMEKEVHASMEQAHVSRTHSNLAPAHVRMEHAAYVSRVHAHVREERAAVVGRRGNPAPAHVSTGSTAHVSGDGAQVRLERETRNNLAPAHVSGEWVAHVKVLAHVSEDRAAVVIQSHFRSYLARRALRALRSLVKLQALVRGHIMRKQTLHQMHSLLRVQARARAGRAQIFDSPSSSAKSSQFCHPVTVTPEKFEHNSRSNSARRDHSPILKRIGSKPTSRMINDQDKQQNDWYWSGHIRGHSSKNASADNEKSDKIVEIDTVKSHLTPQRKNFFHSTHGLYSDQYSNSFSTSKDSTTHQTLPSPSSYEVRSFSPLKDAQVLDESPFCTAQNSPQFYSASSRSRKSPFTPTKSDVSKSYLSGYSDHPNYMACTESSRAKTRSVSAPRQRLQVERSGSARRYLVYNYDESKISVQRTSAIHASFVNKAYPGSGRLDRLGLPVINNCYLNGY